MGSLRILIADHERQSADNMTRLLHRWGHDVQVACDSCETLKTAEWFEPHLAFLELSLVGVGALRLRRKPGLAKTRFIALVDQRQALIQADLHFGESLVKPVPPLALLEALVRVRERIEQYRERVLHARATVQAAEEEHISPDRCNECRGDCRTAARK